MVKIGMVHIHITILLKFTFYAAMTEHEAILENLQQLAKAVVSLFGKNCEACVHNLSSLQSSLTYIEGDVTKRKKGAPATDLLIKLLRQNEASPENMHDYTTMTNDGRSLKSATTFIKDSSGTPVAAFCINFDTTDFYNANQALMPFITSMQNGSGEKSETFAHSVSETVEAIFREKVEEIGKHPTTMSVEEKTKLIELLEESGTFKLKGTVDQVAHLMGVTKFTVYNYLKKIRNNNPQEH